MSEAPENPGGRRGKRTASSAAGDAYQGAFEAVLAVLVGAGFGYWVDTRWDTSPVGVIAGVVIGFAAMVLRLLRLGRELVPKSDTVTKPGSTGAAGTAVRGSGTRTDGEVGRDPRNGVEGALDESDRGPAEQPALSDVWRDDATDERK